MDEFESKQPAEAYYLTFDFADEIRSATISSFSLTAVDLLDNSSSLSTITNSSLATISEQEVLIWAMGGIDQHDYLLTLTILDSTGETHEKEKILPVREIVAGPSLLIIEDGSLSTPSANSYITLTEADQYCKEQGYSSWFVKSNEDKETAILRAMVFIDAQNFKGHKTGFDNPLAWPRIGVYGDSSTSFNYPTNYEFYSEYPIDQIPKALKRGLAEAAYLEAMTPGQLLSSTTTNIKRKKVDVLEVEYFSAQPPEIVFSRVLALMKEIVEPSSNSFHYANVLRT